jgi:predicted dehydrogenase
MSRPRIGFVGTGWIGRHRMAAMLATGLVEACAICEPDPRAAAEARALAADAAVASSLDALLDHAPDGVVIATPSALHAAQSIRALEAGAAVFCQKPLGRDSSEVEAVLAAARAADRLLGVDLSYRFTEGMRAVRELVRLGALGDIYAADLVFNNAYGPDKTWFYDPALSGGGCMIDLGIHLVDLMLWTLDYPAVTGLVSRLHAKGRPAGAGEVEDHGVAMLDLEGGATVRLACSWHLPAGCDAVISATFYGPGGAAAFRNLGGSFYDFTAERLEGTRRHVLAQPPDDWGGRAAAAWAAALAGGERFDGSTTGLIEASTVLDRIYREGRQAALPGPRPERHEAALRAQR